MARNGALSSRNINAMQPIVPMRNRALWTAFSLRSIAIANPTAHIATMAKRNGSVIFNS
jgi:hypothetical protein